MRAIYLNENDVLPHIGCKAVANAHEILFERLGIQVVHTFYKNDLWSYKRIVSHSERVAAISRAYAGLLGSVDAVIVNAEGTLHHGRGEDILAMVAAGTAMGKKTYLINALIQDMEEFSAVLAGCTAIVTRDPRSYAEASLYNSQASLVPDSFILANFEERDDVFAPEDIVVTDYLGTMPDGPGHIVDRLLKEKADECTYLPFQSPFHSAEWRSVVHRLSQARCVVSARHHGLYAAGMAGRPIVILESNSHKMAAFREMYGDFIPVIKSYEEVESAIEQACAMASRFEELPKVFAEYDLLSHYSQVFGRQLLAPTVQNPSAKPVNLPASRESTKTPTIVSRVWHRLSLKGVPKPAASPADSPEPTDWMLAYCTDLLDAKRRRDPRLLPLRDSLKKIAGLPSTYRRFRSFWDAAIRTARARPFLIDELIGLLPNIQDGDLLVKLATIASRAEPDSGYYGLSLATLNTGLGGRTPRIRMAIEHVRNALKADSNGECAWLIEQLGTSEIKQQTMLLNAVVPILSELHAYKDIIGLTALYPQAEVVERNRLKVAEAHFMLGRYLAAVRILESITEDPDLALTADHRRGRIMVHVGDFVAGWPLMNRVVGREHFTEIADKLGLPVWSGRSEDIERVVVWFHELGGIGGEILWGQLIPEFKKLARCELRLVVDPRLLVMFKASFPDCEVLSRDESFELLREGADAFVFGRELTQLVVTHESDFQSISAHQCRLPEVQNGLNLAGHRKHIAISWKTTNPASAMYRNIPLEKFAETLAKFDCEFHCLQHGDIREDLNTLKSKLGSRLHANTFDPSAPVEDMGGRLLKMDGVVTIDNTTLHIAGALGVPTLALISIPAYWQWPAGGLASRWYESVKLLRQDAPGHWQSVLDQISTELESIITHVQTLDHQ